jgi:hypothetical protein
MIRQYFSSETLADVLGETNAGRLFDLDQGAGPERFRAMDGRYVFVEQYTRGDHREAWVIYEDELGAANERQAEEMATVRFIRERMARLGKQAVEVFRPATNLTPDGEQVPVLDLALVEMDIDQDLITFYNEEWEGAP